MQHTASRKIVVTQAEKAVVDGRLMLTLNTDLNAHGHLGSIPSAEIHKLVNNALDCMIINLDELVKKYDKRGYSE